MKNIKTEEPKWKRKPNFNFKATGIGTVPFTDIRGTCLNILKKLPEIPYWPQFVKRSRVEDMNIQFSEALPMLNIDEDRVGLVVSSDESMQFC